jgi:hypothetical protein
VLFVSVDTAGWFLVVFCVVGSGIYVTMGTDFPYYNYPYAHNSFKLLQADIVRIDVAFPVLTISWQKRKGSSLFLIDTLP